MKLHQDAQEPCEAEEEEHIEFKFHTVRELVEDIPVKIIAQPRYMRRCADETALRATR